LNDYLSRNQKKGRIRPIKLVEEISQILGKVAFNAITLPPILTIRVITKLPNSEQSYKGKVKTHNYINRQNQPTTGKL
jgi:hypothetical protein